MTGAGSAEGVDLRICSRHRLLMLFFSQKIQKIGLTPIKSPIYRGRRRTIVRPMRRAGAAEAPARKQEETAMIRSQRSALAPNPRRLAGLLAAGAIGLALAAGSTAAMAQEAIVGLVTKTEVNPFFVKMRQAAEAEATAKGLKLIARAGKFDGDNEGQV